MSGEAIQRVDWPPRMPGLFHDFLVRPRAMVDGDSWPTGDPDALVIHDEVIDVLWPTLGFIPSYNPCRGSEPQHGLNRWGPTMIHGEGAAVAARLFRAWADLYAVGPPQLRIMGPHFSTVPDDEPDGDERPQLRVVGEDFSTDDDDDEPDDDCGPCDIGVGLSHRVITDERGNGYIRLDIDRDALVAVLRRLAELCDRVAADGELCLLHLGI